MLRGKTAIVTGGGSGLGEATCKLFAEHEANVVIADFNFEAAIRVHSELYQLGYDSIPIKVDVSDRESVDAMVKDVINSYGKIDILVNNAGITMDSTLVKMTQAQWDQVIAVNQTGVFNCTQAVVKSMLEQKAGRIINTSSIVGRFGNFGQTNYAATKAAVIAMTQTWAKELGRKGITINAVAPGFIRTPMTAAMPPEVLEKMAKMVPVQRLGAPEDISNTYLFLASDMGKYVNGAVIAVDGGLVI
ncbi:3-oxoacyl-ACP reductase FabG [Neobacillus drentensis]|uniref:3-oxoacyl-ACP reductase FabG n=1 Tax=Neobacillus drentensis TaxID=220684 RepID=UPI00286131F8|nr:3-oxoacyl-ACP reductase FabG [Neobacillus drentensis]MDR7237143.1 3-oxoacyl-[acyl-carrier protein] reductase [Neobacillus drentensis]